MGLNFKLDVGTLRLDQQVACQRYRQQFLDATSKKTLSDLVAYGRSASQLFTAKSAYALAA